MAIKELMPKLGLTMDEGTITKWHFQNGDSVQEGDVLYELETDKMSNHVEAEADGVLHILRQEGAVVPCIQVVAVIGAPGEDVSALMGDSGAAEAAPVAQVSAETASVGAVEMVSTPEQGRVWATPKAKEVASQRGINLEGVAGTGPQGLITTKDLPVCSPKASPMAVKTAQAAGVSIAGIQKEGRIMKQDVLDSIPLSSLPTPPERIKMSSMRKTIAKNMSYSWNIAPTVTYNVAVDVSEMTALKNTLSKSGQKISYTDILAKMTACALMETPMMNSSIDGEEILLHKTVNLGIAVALEDGLVVPVIPNAERKGIGEISSQIKHLSAKAREGRLTGDDMTGGTFTITNLGMFGMHSFSPIINQPESGILGVNAIVETPVVVDGEIVIRPMMNLSLTADHRTVDGSVGAQFLQRLVQLIQNPWQMLL